MKEITTDQAQEIKKEHYSKDVLLTAAELNNPGSLVQIVTIQPGDTIPAHYHQRTFEFYYVLQGACQLTINERQILLSPGMMLLTEPGDVHRLANPGLQAFKVLVFKTNAGSPDGDTFWADTRAN